MENQIKEQTKLSEIKSKLTDSLNQMDGLTCEIEGRLTALHNLDEKPSVMNEKQIEPKDALGEISRELCRFYDYNERLKTILNHLSKII